MDECLGLFPCQAVACSTCTSQMQKATIEVIANEQPAGKYTLFADRQNMDMVKTYSSILNSFFKTGGTMNTPVVDLSGAYTLKETVDNLLQNGSKSDLQLLAKSLVKMQTEMQSQLSLCEDKLSKKLTRQEKAKEAADCPSCTTK